MAEHLGTTGILHIECRKHSGEPSEYLVSFGGDKDSVGAFYLGRASGFDPLTTLACGASSIEKRSCGNSAYPVPPCSLPFKR